MYPHLKRSRFLFTWLCLPVVIGSLSATVSYAKTYAWEDYSEPFKQTFRFSTTETAVVRVTLPAAFLSASDRIPLFCRMDETSPALRPYLIVNNNRAAFYYLGGNGIVNIRSAHLKAGVNELSFGDQTTTGDLIFISEMHFTHNR